VGLVSTGPLISRTSSLRSVARLTACRASLLLNGGTRANSGDDTVQQINLSTNHPDLLIRVGAKPDGLALAGRSLWVSSGRDGQSSNLTARRASRSDHPSRAGAGAMGLQDGVPAPGRRKDLPVVEVGARMVWAVAAPARSRWTLQRWFDPYLARCDADWRRRRFEYV
jgi:hypothetical protein